MGKLILSLLMLDLVAVAGPREEFIREVVAQCKNVDKKKAEKLATPGRTGTVVQFKLCANAEVELDNGCVVECSKDSSKLGQ